MPYPDDPVGPSKGFGDDAIRLATMGYTYLELAEIIWGWYRTAYGNYAMAIRTCALLKNDGAFSWNS